MPLATLWITALAFGLCIAPGLYYAAFRRRKQYRGVLLQWKTAKSVAFSVVAFVVGLTLFTLACLFFATYVGRMHGWELLNLPSKTLLSLGSVSFILLAGVTLLFAAQQLAFTQLVLDVGIVLPGRFGRWMSHPDMQDPTAQSLLRWELITDYFVKGDYPVTVYHFLLRLPDGAFARRTLRVPFYATHRFDAVLEQKLRREKERRHQSVSNIRKPSGM